MPKAKKKAKKKSIKSVKSMTTTTTTSGVMDNIVSIKYEEYSTSRGTRFRIAVDPLVVPVKVTGEQAKWVLSATGTKAICRVTFTPTSPFNSASPSPSFGPGVGPANPGHFQSGACNTSNTGRYKYRIEIIPSSPSLGAPVIIDPEVEVWDDSPQDDF